MLLLGFILLVVSGCTNQDEAHVAKAEKPKEVLQEGKKVETVVEEGKVPQPIVVAEQERNTSRIAFERYNGDSIIEGVSIKEDEMFPENYTEMEGILSFRGNHLRNQPSYGTASIVEKKLEQKWTFQTTSIGEWGGGAGWTGQASIVKWDDSVKKGMNITETYKGKDNFKEVIQPSLDGKVYFLDLVTGEQTREAISTDNPIKGSVSIDPRGFPLLYVGQGIQQTNEFGYRIFSLIDGKLLHFINGKEPLAYRDWGAFDGAPLINRITDTMYLGGENGLLYQIDLNTAYEKEENTISINPETTMYRYKVNGNDRQGIEGSVAAYRNLLYFADNGGSIQAVDTNEMRPVWALNQTDDTDSTIVLDIENETPMVYTGTEVDVQGNNSLSTIRKINGVTGEVVWRKIFEASSIVGSNPTNGGLLATPVSGKGEISNLIIFTIARVGNLDKGLIVALDKRTGQEVWMKEMDHYSWSSPVDVYTSNGKAYLVQGDSKGNLHLIDGANGETVDQIHLGASIEATPVVYENMIVVATRGGYIYGIAIK